MFAAANILAHEVVVEVGVFVNEGFDQRSLAGHQSGDARAVTGQDAVGMHHNADGHGTGHKVAAEAGVGIGDGHDIAETQVLEAIFLGDLLVVEAPRPLPMMQAGTILATPTFSLPSFSSMFIFSSSSGLMFRSRMSG